MEDQQILLKSKIHHITFNHVISRLRYNTSYTDVTLACNGKFYLLHKLVLAICSEYFSEILEITECSNSMIILTGIQCSDLEMLLDYMYTGEVNVKKDKIASLMQAAEFLRINGLASHDEEPESLRCSSVSKKRSPLLNGRRIGEDRSTDISPGKSCTLSMRNLTNSEKQGEKYPIQRISFANSKEAKSIATTDEKEDVSDIEILYASNFPDDLQTTMEEDGPLSISDDNASDLGGSSGIIDNTTPSCVSDEIGFTKSLSGAVAEKQSPPLKRIRTDTGRSPGYSSSGSFHKLILDPDSSLYYGVTETLVLDNGRQVLDNGRQSRQILCNQGNCNQGFSTLDYFRHHLSNKHGEDHPKIELSFKNREDLEKWKQKFEVDNVVKFRFKKSDQKKKFKVSYYHCNRSSCFLKKSVATGKRKAKPGVKDGPSQISTLCTSGFKLVEKDGLLHVTAYPTHANHPLDDKHKKCLRLPEALKNEYIKQIEMGVPVSVIVGGITEEVKKQYRISYDNLFHLKKKIDDRTGIPTEQSLLSLPDPNVNIESVTLQEL